MSNNPEIITRLFEEKEQLKYHPHLLLDQIVQVILAIGIVDHVNISTRLNAYILLASFYFIWNGHKRPLVWFKEIDNYQLKVRNLKQITIESSAEWKPEWDALFIQHWQPLEEVKIYNLYKNIYFIQLAILARIHLAMHKKE